MRMLNLETLSVINYSYNKTNIIKATIEINEYNDTSIIQIKELMKSEVAAKILPSIVSIRPNFIDIKLKGKTIAEEDVDNLCEFLQDTILQCVVDKNRKRKREKRLDIPKNLIEINAKKIPLLNLINYEALLNIFNIEIECLGKKTLLI